MTVRFTLLGVGAMNSPRYRPAGLLVCWRGRRVALDGGDAADPGPGIDDWLVCDERAELMPSIRRRARELGVSPRVGEFARAGVRISPRPVRHTSHPTYGYLVRAGRSVVVWAPEFAELPPWANGADLLFADAAGWNRPIRFARGVGGHADVWQVAEAARLAGVARLVFAHIGRPSIRAIDRGEHPPFGEWGVQGRAYRVG